MSIDCKTWGRCFRRKGRGCWRGVTEKGREGVSVRLEVGSGDDGH